MSTPYFLFPADKGYHQHFLDVYRSTDLPIIVYNPMESSIDRMPRKLLEDISYLDSIVALADSSGDMPYLMEVIEKVEDRMDVLMSNEETIYPSLCVGCSGAILGGAQVHPLLWREMFRSFADGDSDQSQELQARVQKLSRLFMRHGQAVEEAMEDDPLPHGMLLSACPIANVFVHPATANERRVRVNNYKAMRNARSGVPWKGVPVLRR